MSAYAEIQKAQKAWAEQCQKQSYSDQYPYYLGTVGANLRQCLSTRALDGYANGDGSELKDTSRGPAKMKALHSSAALAANFFDYWTDRDDKLLLLGALNIEGNATEPLTFEAKFPTRVSENPPNKHPNLDIAISLSSGHVVAVESKFAEWTGKHTKITSQSRTFAEKYFGYSPGLWEEQELPQCQVLADEIRRGIQRGEYIFHLLGAEQLLKHALGLATQRGKTEFSPHYNEFTLYYLYYDWAGESAEARRRAREHKDEIECFEQSVGKELNFKALTYQEVYKSIRQSEAAEPNYLDYLECRYFSGKGAPA